MAELTTTRIYGDLFAHGDIDLLDGNLDDVASIDGGGDSVQFDDNIYSPTSLQVSSDNVSIDMGDIGDLNNEDGDIGFDMDSGGEFNVGRTGGKIFTVGVTINHYTDTELNNNNINDVASIDGGGDDILFGDNIDLNSNDLEDDTVTIWDTSNQYIPQGRLQNDSLTINSGTQLTGGGSVSLGGSITLNVDEGAGSGLNADLLDGVHLADITWSDVSMSTTDVNMDDVSPANVNVDLNSNDLEDAGTIIWDTSNQYIPQGRLQNDSVTVTAGDGLKNGGSASLGSSTTLDIDVSDFAGSHLSDDGSENLQVDDDFILNSGDTMNGNLTMSGNINAGSDSSYDIGADGTRFANVYADNIYGTVHYADISFEEKKCAICDEPFEVGDSISLIVTNVKEDGTYMVPKHEGC